MIKFLAALIFYGAMLMVAVLSFLMIYVLLRFGHSKSLGILVSSLYLFLMISLFAAALANFNAIAFPEL